MELDKRTIQTQDIGVLAGVLLRTSNTAEAFALEVESLKGKLQEQTAVIAKLTELNKRLIDEKNANVPAISNGNNDGNGIAAAS